MTLVPALRARLSLHKALLYPFSLFASTPPTARASIRLPMRLCATGPIGNSDAKPEAGPENESLLERLTFMGVDVTMVRQRQPSVLRREVTNEHGLARFLQAKGASRKVIAGIISRFPRAITRSGEHLDRRWELWRGVFKSDGEIVSILDRSPESFFRSSDNDKLEKNIAFLSSLGLNAKELHGLLAAAPRTFSNSVALNRQMVELLEDVCAELGGADPEGFAKAVITRNLYVLIRSVKRVKANVRFLRDALRLGDAELLAFLRGAGADVLDLSSDYLTDNFRRLEGRLSSEGCGAADVRKLVVRFPSVLYIGGDTLSAKLDCLIGGGVTVRQVLEKPKVLDYSTQNIAARLEELNRVGYDFKVNGIAVLDSSRKRFDAKLERLGRI